MALEDDLAGSLSPLDGVEGAVVCSPLLGGDGSEMDEVGLDAVEADDVAVADLGEDVETVAEVEVDGVAGLEVEHEARGRALGAVCGRCRRVRSPVPGVRLGAVRRREDESGQWEQFAAQPRKAKGTATE